MYPHKRELIVYGQNSQLKHRNTNTRFLVESLCEHIQTFSGGAKKNSGFHDSFSGEMERKSYCVKSFKCIVFVIFDN